VEKQEKHGIQPYHGRICTHHSNMTEQVW